MNQINELIHFHRIKVWNNLHCVHGRGNFRVLLPYVRQEWHSEERGQEGKGVQYNKHESTPTEHHFSRKDSKSKLARKKLFFLTSLFPPLRISGPYIVAQWMITNVLTHYSSKPWCLALESLHMHHALAVRGSQWPKFGVE